MKDPCLHPHVEVLRSDRHEGETYGDVYGRCEVCGADLKAFGLLEDDPNSLTPYGPWECDEAAEPRAKLTPEEIDHLFMGGRLVPIV